MNNLVKELWTGRDLNPGPPPCKGGALPTELPAHNKIFRWYDITKWLFKFYHQIIDIMRGPGFEPGNPYGTGS